MVVPARFSGPKIYCSLTVSEDCGRVYTTYTRPVLTALVGTVGQVSLFLGFTDFVTFWAAPTCDLQSPVAGSNRVLDLPSLKVKDAAVGTALHEFAESYFPPYLAYR